MGTESQLGTVLFFRVTWGGPLPSCAVLIRYANSITPPCARCLHSMDLLKSLEIYIPVEAEVKSIPLKSLPSSVLRRMSLPLFDAEGSRKDKESPEGIWICPAVLRKKGQKAASRGGDSGIENMSSLMSREFQSALGPHRISFVSSNRAAYAVLKDTLPGNKVSAHTPHSSLLPTGSVPRTYQYAVIIYHGCIYLSIKKPSESRSQREKREPQPASQSAVPSTSDMSTKSRKKRHSPQASLKPADKELQRKRLRVTLPQISPNQPKNLLTESDQELLNDNSPKKKHTACKEPLSENRKDVTFKGRDLSSSKTARSVPQSTDGEHNLHSHCHKDARGEEAAEEAAGPEPAWFQPQREWEEVAPSDSEIQHLGSEEAESTNQNNDMGGNMKIDSGEPDNVVGVVAQSSNQSWTRNESGGAARVPTSLQQEVDFNELAQEERIALTKARLRQRSAALNSLHPSK
ncbi:uncharacterized protein si:dkeyp-110g5.4 isoform X2 [Chelmon rostratus]|uniref:uncharacterized protein si:dkeyp-110g5.4 isoform X2 n=1 Tax=Chelmon rostratus TaxID=109905 RepID=UPI001BEB4DD1|nr:uncharacterized protein si:dkeyp-110g5.4 isoform X2 [Chelmon rostratus]